MRNSDLTDEKILEGLLQFSKGMIEGEDGKALISKYQYALDKITPSLMIKMENKQLTSGISPAKIKKSIEKMMNVFHEHLKNYKWEKPGEGHPIYYYMQENRELEKLLDLIKESLAAKDFKKVKFLLPKLAEIENHYIRKENILFPYLERIWEDYLPLQVMWSLHDDIRNKLKILQDLTNNSDDFTPKFIEEIGELFFLMYGMIFKEELVVFPKAMETIKAKETWDKIQNLSEELGYSYIEAPQNEKPNSRSNGFTDLFWKVETGELDFKQIDLLLNHLPIDITFVDENDEVRYFSRAKDRFFPRSPAIIGRKVHNCHPPESMHIVEKIISEFKKGNRNEAKFWFHMKGKFILIRYFAMRDEAGNYKGVLEVGEDITEINQISGEQRLLDWE